ncbi:hypothetical protein SISSUDRAFT_1129640, partial [Sistotremastrum suecicum HHB10207 ss-3]
MSQRQLASRKSHQSPRMSIVVPKRYAMNDFVEPQSPSTAQSRSNRPPVPRNSKSSPILVPSSPSSYSTDSSRPSSPSPEQQVDILDAYYDSEAKRLRSSHSALESLAKAQAQNATMFASWNQTRNHRLARRAKEPMPHSESSCRSGFSTESSSGTTIAQPNTPKSATTHSPSFPIPTNYPWLDRGLALHESSLNLLNDSGPPSQAFVTQRFIRPVQSEANFARRKHKRQQSSESLNELSRQLAEVSPRKPSTRSPRGNHEHRYVAVHSRRDDDVRIIDTYGEANVSSVDGRVMRPVLPKDFTPPLRVASKRTNHYVAPLVDHEALHDPFRREPPPTCHSSPSKSMRRSSEPSLKSAMKRSDSDDATRANTQKNTRVFNALPPLMETNFVESRSVSREVPNLRSQSTSWLPATNTATRPRRRTQLLRSLFNGAPDNAFQTAWEKTAKASQPHSARGPPVENIAEPSVVQRLRRVASRA